MFSLMICSSKQGWNVDGFHNVLLGPRILHGPRGLLTSLFHVKR